MPYSPLSSLTAFEARKKNEEFAIQHTPPCPIQPLEFQPIFAQDRASLSTSSIRTKIAAKTTAPIETSASRTQEALLKKIDEISKTPPSELKPLDVLFFEVMKIMEQESSSAIKTREMLLSAQKEWQHLLEKEMITSSEKARTSQNTNNLFTRIAQALGPLSVILAGGLACATGGVSLIALGAVAIGALFFIDALFDDVTKKAVASLLARGEKEEQEAWLQRIRLGSSIISMCLNMGTSIPQALQIASIVSQTALEGIQAGYGYSRDSAKARLTELKGSFEISKNDSDLLMQKWELIMSGILERYEIFLSLQKARSETKRQIIHNL
jgi:hypothetical protein